MNIYLERPQLLIGGIVCVVIAALLASFLRNTAGVIIAGIFSFVGIIAIISSFGGSSVGGLQFLLFCFIIGAIGIGIFKSGGLGPKVVGAAVVVLALAAGMNSSLNLSNIPFLDRDLSRGVAAAFREAGRVLDRVFDEATVRERDNGSRNDRQDGRTNDR